MTSRSSLLDPVRALGFPLLTGSLLVLGAMPSAQAAPPEDPALRPYGNAMGDGLRLSDHPPAPTESVVCADGETLFGIDVSYYQGNIDWNAVAADGVSFAWVRVSHSLQFYDPEFETNLAGARAAGIHTGVYQYFEPSEDPVAQADLLLDSMGPLLPGDMPPMIDVESPDPIAAGPYADAIGAWIDRIEDVTGVRPFIYTGYYYWNDNVGGTGQFADYPLWIANYNAGCPLIPDVWQSWTVHQYCACESVNGISGAVDGDTFNGSLADLEALAVGAGVCGDGICDGTEDEFGCPTDCPPCAVIEPDGRTIDDDDECHERYGPQQYWRTEVGGIGDSLHWTAATEFADPSNYAIWRLFFEEAGLYSVEVHVQSPWAESQQAAYRIAHAGGESVQVIDQSAMDGWRHLGDFQFDAASDHWVRLDDNTGEPVAEEIGIVYDALRVVRLDGSADETGHDTGTDPDGTTGSPSDDGPPGGTGGGDSGDSSGGTFALPNADGDDGGGCGCRSAPSRSLPALLTLLVLGLRRRTRRPF